MKSMKVVGALTGGALALGAGSAFAATMHPELGAKLSGMGEHGIVNLTVAGGEGQALLDVRRADEGHHRRVDSRLARDDRREARHDVPREGLRDGHDEGARR